MPGGSGCLWAVWAGFGKLLEDKALRRLSGVSGSPPKRGL